MTRKPRPLTQRPKVAGKTAAQAAAQHRRDYLAAHRDEVRVEHAAAKHARNVAAMHRVADAARRARQYAFLAATSDYDMTRRAS